MAQLPPSEVAYEKAHFTEDKGPVVIGVSAFLIVFVTVGVSLRFIARRVRRMPLLWDDWLALVGMVLVICMCVINIVSVQYGLGKHLIATNPATGYRILQAGWFLSLDYYLCHWFIKVSIVLSYKRIFMDHTRWVKITYWLIIGYMTLWTIGCVIVVLAECRPLSYFWNQYNISLQPPPQGYCVTNASLDAIVTSALATAIDFVLLILPAILLFRLHMPLYRKLAISSIFSVGLLACIASIFRLTSTVVVTSPGSDTTWETSDLYLWTASEAAVALVCGCFPTIGPLLKTSFEVARGRTSFKASSMGQSSYHGNSDKSSKFSRRSAPSQPRSTELKHLSPYDYNDRVIRRTDQVTVSNLSEGDTLHSQGAEEFTFIHTTAQ